LVDRFRDFRETCCHHLLGSRVGLTRAKR